MSVNLTKMTANVNNIQALSDLPNQTDGLTAQGLKERFDKAGSDIKTFMNTSLIPEVEQAFSSEVISLLNAVFPVGRGFIDFTDTDYSNYLGFTWERELVGMTPVGLNTNDEDFNAVGKTGGEKAHTLTIAEMPRHYHTVDGDFTIANKKGTGVSGIPCGNSGWGSYGRAHWINSSWNSKGESQEHNNMQPYKVVSYWKRIS